jgi:hypothetical protein
VKALLAVLVATEVAHRVLRARTPGTPPGDQDDEHEDNTFDLPEGRPIRRAFKRFAKKQLRNILSKLPEIGAPLPDRMPSVADRTDPMASAMTPIIGAYWDEAGQTTRAMLGLDPDLWDVHDPHLHDQISKAAFQFCDETNRTTDLELIEALETLRQEFIEGLVTEGDSIAELTKRVQGVFKGLSTWRAEMIGRTEASRAVHAASLESARQSGVVQGKKWLASGDCCERCAAVASMFAAGTALDHPFEVNGTPGPYALTRHPPLHPHCMCSITYVLTDWYQKILEEVGPPEPDGFETGSLGPDLPAGFTIAKGPAVAPKRPRPVYEPAPYEPLYQGPLEPGEEALPPR